jgi:hypothetical protein
MRRYLRILGSNHDVVLVWWLMKYTSPSWVVACSHPSGRGPRAFASTDFVPAKRTINSQSHRSFCTNFPLKNTYKLIISVFLKHSSRRYLCLKVWLNQWTNEWEVQLRRGRRETLLFRLGRGKKEYHYVTRLPPLVLRTALTKTL